METQHETGIVLYAEDDENDVEFMQRAFRKAGLCDRLHVVRDGKQAVDYLSGSGSFADRQLHPLPALLVLDVNLPVLSGFGVLRWVRNHQNFYSLPVMILTSSEEPEEKMKAISLGAIDFITKPDSGAKFTEVLSHFWR